MNQVRQTKKWTRSLISEARFLPSSVVNGTIIFDG
jgi:hypothetical protein